MLFLRPTDLLIIINNGIKISESSKKANWSLDPLGMTISTEASQRRAAVLTPGLSTNLVVVEVFVVDRSKFIMLKRQRISASE